MAVAVEDNVSKVDDAVVAEMRGDAFPDEVVTDGEFRQYCIENPDMVHEFDVDELIADPQRNGRFKERTIKDESVKELAAAMRSVGRQLEHGRVSLGMDGKVYVLFGTGRYLAIKLINSMLTNKKEHWKFKATVHVETQSDPAMAFVENAQENWYREELGVLDKAMIVQRLTLSPYNLSRAEVQKRLAIKNRSVVSTLISIAEFPDEVKAHIVAGRISSKAAYDLSVINKGEALTKEVAKLLGESGGKKVTVSKVAGERQKKSAASKVRDKDDAQGRHKVGRKQRSPKQILDFIEAEGVIANEKKYGDKNLSEKLQCFAAFVKGGREETFLKNLAAF